MTINAEISCDDPDQLRSLGDWLRLEDDLRGRVTLRARPIQPGEMGGVLDVLAVTLGTGGFAGTFVQSIFLWLKQRREGASVTLRLKDGNGRTAEVDLTGVRDADAAIQQVMGFLDQN